MLEDKIPTELIRKHLLNCKGEEVRSFVNKPCEFEELVDSDYAQLHYRCFNSKLARDEKDYIFQLLRDGVLNSRKSTALRGWLFDFSKILKQYIVKFNGDGKLLEVYAPDKTSIRKYFEWLGISSIHEIKGAK